MQTLGSTVFYCSCSAIILGSSRSGRCLVVPETSPSDADVNFKSLDVTCQREKSQLDEKVIGTEKRSDSEVASVSFAAPHLQKYKNLNLGKLSTESRQTSWSEIKEKQSGAEILAT